MIAELSTGRDEDWYLNLRRASLNYAAAQQ